MDGSKMIVSPVILKGLNYLLWSRTMKTTLMCKGLWSHVILNEAPRELIEEAPTDEQGREAFENMNKWFQEDRMALFIIQSSLEGSLLEAYSYCDTAKELWETLKNVYGNTSNLMRIYEVKKAINDLHQEDMEFTKVFGKYRSLWAELEMLRPNTIDPLIINERREQDKVFGLLMVLNSNYSELIKHLLREDKLPSLEDVCAKVQKEQGAHGLFGGNGKGELINAHKVWLKPEAKKGLICEHCKRKGHNKDKCWLIHPHLKPSWWKDPKAHVSQEATKGSSLPNHNNQPGFSTTISQGGALQSGPFQLCQPGHSYSNQEGAQYGLSRGNSQGGFNTYQGGPSTIIKSQPNSPDVKQQAMVSTQKEVVTKSDLEALIKALKESGISGHTFTASIAHHCYNSHALKPLIVDSGASHHMISDHRLISDIEPALGNVMIANGEQIPIRGIGNLRLFGKESKAFYMPSFASNLLSVKRTTSDLNCYAIFGPNEFFFQDIESNKVLGRGGTKDELYVLEETAPSLSFSSSSVLNNAHGMSVTSLEGGLWHARLGHPHVKALSLLFPKILFSNDACEACILGKHCRSVFSQSKTIYNKCFELVHSDVWTSPCESRDNHKYFVTFIDEKSKYTWITLLPSKDRVLEAFKNFHSHVTNHFHVKLKCLRSDNGGEYTSRAFKEFLNQQGITHQTSCPYTPQQNGVAERKNRHLMDVARSLMFHMHVPKRFWSDAVIMACYLINRLPTRILQDKSPFEVLNKTKPSLDHLKVFGCVCFVLLPGEQRTKLDAKSSRAMFLGYSPTQRGYKCYIPETRKILVSRDVKFLETTSFYEGQKWEDIKDISAHPSDRAANLRTILQNLGLHQFESRPDPSPSLATTSRSSDHEGGQDVSSEYSDVHDQATDVNQDQEATGVQDQDGSFQNFQDQDGSFQDQITSREEPVELRRSTRLKFPPEHWKNTRVYYNNQAVAHPNQAVCSLAYIPQGHQAFTASLDQECVPKSYEEAKEQKVWRDAVTDERQAMERNRTWDEADLPKGKKAVSSRWIFTIKYKSNGEIERYKARLVARGFTQTYGDDYRDTFAPVAKLHTVRVILSLATNLEWDLWQMDVKNAFLQGELDEEVYMTPPPGLEDTVRPGKVLRLRKAIYGLKQSPRAWYHKLNVTLRDRGFRRSESDHTLFTLQSQAGIVVILIYVDDIIISGNDKVGISETKEYLKSVFDIKDLGELKYFLGIEVCRLKDGLFISQRKYIHDLLSDAGMTDAKAAKTPIAEDYKAEPEGEYEQSVFDDPRLYRRLVGKLIYLTITRPDLCFAVNQVSQHMQEPKMYHWKLIDRILRYLKGTCDQGIWMGNTGCTEIVGYCDADWAGDRQDRKSTTGYCTFIGGNLVTWKTKKQKVVSCSSAEAEYRAMRKLTTECIWLKALLQDLGIESKAPITMHCDNQAAIHIASNSVFHERTKHIEVDCHKVREAVEKGVILPCYTRSSDQLADIFTKATSIRVHESMYEKLGLMSLPSP